MEARSLGPPPALEKIVLSLIPPVARESVAGDLWEMYRGPGAYLRDALPVVFFVVLSQMRRGANPPLLVLQAFLLFVLCSRVMATGAALGLTGMVVIIRLLLGAYQGGGRVSARRAMIEAVLVAGGAAELSGLMAAHLVRPDWSEAPYFTFLGPYLVPIFCLMRTIIMRWGDRLVAAPPAALCAVTLRQRYAQLQRNVARRNGVEIAALVGAAFVLSALPLAGPVYLSAVLYLLLGGSVPDCGAHAGMRELRALYQQQLIRQHATRCFLWWLWFTPLLLSLPREFSAGGRHMTQLTAMAAILLLGYFIESLNRERHGQVREEIGQLLAAD